MTVKELKETLANVPDNYRVSIAAFRLIEADVPMSDKKMQMSEQYWKDVQVKDITIYDNEVRIV